jgi:hypothetical protein
LILLNIQTKFVISSPEEFDENEAMLANSRESLAFAGPRNERLTQSLFMSQAGKVRTESWRSCVCVTFLKGGQRNPHLEVEIQAVAGEIHARLITAIATTRCRRRSRVCERGCAEHTTWLALGNASFVPSSL